MGNAKMNSQKILAEFWSALLCNHARMRRIWVFMTTPNAKTMKHAPNGQLHKEVNFWLGASSLGIVAAKELMRESQPHSSAHLVPKKKGR